VSGIAGPSEVQPCRLLKYPPADIIPVGGVKVEKESINTGSEAMR
jgi:hypothetical protein